MNNFYVYQYMRERDTKHGKANTPYYVGKGHGNRAFMRHHRITTPSDPNRIQFVARELTEKDAFQIEVLLIALYGRLDKGTGCLGNLTDGGEGIRGHRWKRGPLSAEHKAKLEEKRWGPMRGKPGHRHTPEIREQIRQKLIGQTRPAEAIAKMSASMKGRHSSPATQFKKGHKMSPETIAKFSAKLKGRTNNPDGMLGRKHTPEALAKMSEKVKVAWARRKEAGTATNPHSEETKHKIRLAHLGKPHPHKGQVFSEQARLNMSMAQKRRFAK